MSILSNMPSQNAHFRFYEELNDFLPKSKKKTRFLHPFKDSPTIKDMIESIGVPHCEIDLILVNGKSVDFEYHPKDGDDISVYPVFESFDISSITRLRPKPLRTTKFILDIQLGKLARYLRLLGFDSIYENNLTDEEIVDYALKNKRIILTRNLGLLKRKSVSHGYWVRNTNPDKQIIEILERFDLKNSINAFTLCLDCNNKLIMVKKKQIQDQLLPKTKKYFEQFYQCKRCQKIYWQGSHFERMQEKIEQWKKTGSEE